MIGWLIRDASVVRASNPTTLQMTSKVHQLPQLASDFTVTWEPEIAPVISKGNQSPEAGVIN